MKERRLTREPRYAREDLTLANVFTLSRIVAIPVFGWLWATGHDEAALWVFAGAAITDVIDGFLARYLNQKSRLGSLLDPIADKLLMFVALAIGTYLGAIPLWLAVAVIGRDAVLGIGVLGFLFVWRGRHEPESWRPTRLGKYAMTLQSTSVFSAIIDDILAPPGFRPWLQVVLIMTAVLTIIAGAQYVTRAIVAWRKTAAPPRATIEG